MDKADRRQEDLLRLLLVKIIPVQLKTKAIWYSAGETIPIVSCRVTTTTDSPQLQPDHSTAVELIVTTMLSVGAQMTSAKAGTSKAVPSLQVLSAPFPPKVSIAVHSQIDLATKDNSLEQLSVGATTCLPNPPHQQILYR